jgi:feruloyl-CoA synthase
LLRVLETFSGEASSGRIVRIMVLSEPPSIDADEITDKGYLNQRAVLERRSALVEKMYLEKEKVVIS